MKIKHISVRTEKENSVSNYTVICEVHLKNGTVVSSFLTPLTFSSENFKSNIDNAVEIIEHTLSSLLEGKTCDLVECDVMLEEFYKDNQEVPELKNLIMGISIAIAKTQAHAEKIEPFELLADFSENETVTIPYPFYQTRTTLLEDNLFPLQNIFLLPLGASSFRHSLNAFEILSKDLTNHNTVWANSPETIISNIHELLVKHDLQDVFSIGIEANAAHLYNKENGDYKWLTERISSQELFSFYKNSIEQAGVFSIQNGFAQDDVLGAQTFLEVFGNKVQLVAHEHIRPDNIIALTEIATHANACIIDFKEYITVTQALTHVMNIRATGINTIIAAYNYDINFIVDFAVGTSAGQLQPKKHNNILFERLLELEDVMTFSLLS